MSKLTILKGNRADVTSRRSVSGSLALSDAASRITAEDHAALKLWLNLFATSQSVKVIIRRRLHEQYDTSLARFDYLAQLYRAKNGLRMQELSSRLMVTGGNVTGLTDSLEKDGHVQRISDTTDRRAFRIKMTARGKKHFEEMAKAHENWIAELFGKVSARDLEELQVLLRRLKQSVQSYSDE
jgi:DNA-binding MarR family transcriptional regulator